MAKPGDGKVMAELNAYFAKFGGGIGENIVH
jgi:hypothetical protein